MASLECAVGEEHVAATWEGVEVDFERREEIFGSAGHSLVLFWLLCTHSPDS